MMMDMLAMAARVVVCDLFVGVSVAWNASLSPHLYFGSLMVDCLAASILSCRCRAVRLDHLS